MVAEYAEYLAANVLNEQQLVSYRSLSRALKVHVNLAKQMLFDFHQKQNAKKPGSVHATYLLTGTRTPPKSQQQLAANSQDGEDAVMQSSPPIPQSSAPQATEDDAQPTPIKSILIVKEEHLEQAKATFDRITGIHVYSLSAGVLSDLNLLQECNRKITAECASEDPLETWKQYGTIRDPNCKRRTQKRPPTVAPAPSAKEPATKPKPVPALEKQSTKASNESEPSSAKATPVPEKDTDASKKKTATKPVTTKRQPSDIFKSFAKGANKKKAASTESSAAPSPAPAPAAAEDESMGGMSDDDPGNAAEDEEIQVDAGTGKSKKDREADLKAMMDAEDEPMEDAAEVASDEAIDTPKEETIDAPGKAKEEEPRETMTVENGRRRGRRRVMKKKTVKDDEGYLVTREEAAWESFSEEEPAPKKAKPTPAPAAKGNAKKGAAKPGQGSIMSFFGKKP